MSFTEYEQTRPFNEIVLDSQRQWENYKGKAIALDRAYALPKGFQRWMYQLVLNHLPDYISPQDKERIISTHPTPIISLGLTQDRRYRQAPHENSIRIIDTMPTFQNEAQAQAFIRGIVSLDEIAVDTLTEDIIRSIAEDNREKGGFGNVFAKVLETSTNRRQFLGGNIFGEYAISLLAHHTEKTAEEFKRLIAQTAVSGNPTKLNTQLEEMNALKGVNVDISQLGNLAVLFGGRLQIKYGEVRTLEPTRRQLISEAFGLEGTASLIYPGVIELVAMNKVLPALSLLMEAASTGYALHDWRYLIIPALNILPSALAVQSFLGMIYTTIHEIVHYLCMDSNRRGLPLVAPTVEE